MEGNFQSPLSLNIANILQYIIPNMIHGRFSLQILRPQFGLIAQERKYSIRKQRSNERKL